jgi:hypothetical protein
VGELTAVAVWPQKPTPDQLLQRRLADGWEPTLTPLQQGAAVLGHAACAVGPTAALALPDAPPNRQHPLERPRPGDMVKRRSRETVSCPSEEITS